MEPLKKRRIDELQFEHKLWLNQLSFYSDELNFHIKRLEKLGHKNSYRDTGTITTHFRYNFIHQREVLDSLTQKIKSYESKLPKEAAGYPTDADYKLYSDHDGLREEIEIHGWLFRELKAEFNYFVSEKL